MPIILTGEELGAWSSMKELRKLALVFAERFIGQSFQNADTGHDILVSKTGVKHTIAAGQDTLLKTVPAIPSLLETAQFMKSEPDKTNDVNVLSVESYTTILSVAGETHQVMLKVKQYKDKRRYYDHGFIVS